MPRRAIVLFLCVAFPASLCFAETGAPFALDPGDAANALSCPDDLRIELVLSEPEIEQPVFVNFDHRGRMWVVEYRQYPHPAGLNIVSTDQYYRNVYDSVPPAPPNHVRGKDRISIHEDSDGDGNFDKHKVFVDGLNMVTSVTVGRGGVWVLNPPYLQFYPDADGDDVPDGDPITHLKGFWLEDTHSIANSLRWGPDGWLYGCQGSTVSSDIEVVGKTDGKPLHSLGQLVWRYHPTRREFEIWAEGGGNAFGLEIDSKGRIFSGHNGGDTRGFHYPQHGYLRKGFSKHGPLSNPFAFGFFPHMPHNKVSRFTHNFVIYEADLLPKKYHGKLFGVDPMNKNVPVADIQREGATFKTNDVDHAIQTKDPWFRPVDIKHGPDGCIYICDWYDQQLAHTTNHRGNVDLKRGRIYRIASTQDRPTSVVPDHSKLTNAELGLQLASTNRWTRETARRIIGDRGSVTLANNLKPGFESLEGQLALETLWAINLSGGFDEAFAMRALRHADPYVRVWAVRLLGDQKTITDQAAYGLERLANDDAHVEVRSQLASSSRRLSTKHALPIVVGLLRHDEDTDDRYMPLLNWWAVECRCEKDAEDVLKLFEDASLWRSKLVEDHILERLARRFASTNRREDYLRCARLLTMHEDQSSRGKLLKGIESAWSGRIPVGVPTELATAMTAAGGGSLPLRVRLQRPEAISEAVTVITDPKSGAAIRSNLILLLGATKHAETLPILKEILRSESDSAVLSATLTAIAGFDDNETPRLILKRLGKFPEEVLQGALSVLVSRADWARVLFNSVKEEQIDRLAVPLQTIRAAFLHQDDELRKLISEIYGPIKPTTTEEMTEKIAMLTPIVEQRKGSPYDGQPLFNKHCGKCHRLFGKGGGIGPDLTSYQRTDVRRILENVVDPDREIREGFENFTVFTSDGRIHTGLVTDRDANLVVLKSADGRTESIPRTEIEEMERSNRSLMPTGLLDELSEQEIQDLFAYLRSSQPLNN